jgi:hypothetical protein
MLAFSTYQRVTSFPRKSPTLERKLLAQPFGYGMQVPFYCFEAQQYFIYFSWKQVQTFKEI